MPLIKLTDITKVYDTGKLKFTALKKINLTIEEGEFVAIMGPSGSGKSTLMNILGFLDTPSGGTYFFNQKKVTNYDENSLADIRNTEIGFVFQSFYLLSDLTAIENVRLPMIYAQVPEKQQIERASELLSSVGLGDKLNNRPNEMSGGQQQRVAISRSLANNPKILFADEPTGNIDSKSSKEVMKILSDLNNQGRTIIMVTHSKETANYAHRVITIKDGEIIKDQSSKPPTKKSKK